jgi:hypothetical protein
MLKRLKTQPLLAAALLIGGFAVTRVSRTMADELGTSFAASAALAAAELARALPPPPSPLPAPAEELVAAATDAEPETIAAGPRGARRPGKQAVAKPKRGIFISSATVLRLAQARAIPNAVPVASQGTRPAGLKLVGVSGLGVGMRDGDVLTRVAGAPASSVPAVVQGVIAARARHAREISAEFWRDGAPWSLTVEQPYLEANSPP